MHQKDHFSTCTANETFKQMELLFHYTHGCSQVCIHSSLSLSLSLSPIPSSSLPLLFYHSSLTILRKRNGEFLFLSTSENKFLPKLIRRETHHFIVYRFSTEKCPYSTQKATIPLATVLQQPDHVHE